MSERRGNFRGNPRGNTRENPPPNARLVALNVLQDVTRSSAYASLSLSKRLREARLAPLDREFITALVYGTLENQIQLDYVLDSLLRDTDIDPLLRDLLRMGAYQLLHMDRVPENAAVDESVKLIKIVNLLQYSGVVNAVLRNLIRWKEEIRWPEDPVERLSVQCSVPLWLTRRLIEAYGEDVAREIVQYKTQEHGLVLRPNRMITDPSAFEAYMRGKGWNFAKGRVPEAYRVTGLGDVGAEEGFRRGLYSVQGESSILAVQCAGVKRGMKVLDACAAPGGKTAYMAEIMQGSGRIYAWDLHEHRVELIRSAVRRLGVENVRMAQRDATEFRGDLEGMMDAVLLDAPCSGLGVMLDKPDVKYRQSPEAVASLVELQQRLLETCCRYVRPGGVLLYSTCSILPEENGDQIEGFLGRHPEFQLAALPVEGWEQGEKGLQILAHVHGLEGFFIARMVRKS